MTDELPNMKRFERRELDVVVTYEDGSEFQITYDDLRHACPCAKCSPLRNVDEASKNLRRQVEALPKKSPKFELLGIMLLDLNGLKDAQVESIVSNEFGI